MKHKILTFILLLTTGLVFFGGYSSTEIDIHAIEKVELIFEGNPIDNYSYVLTEKENIEESIRIFNNLKTYKSPQVSTWFESVTYKITYNNGEIEKHTYKKIRPVTDIFDKIFNSLEVKKQRQSVF